MLHFQRFKCGYLAPGLMLLLPWAAKPGAIEINGICQPTYDCTTAGLQSGALGNGKSASGSFSINDTLGDGDTYNISGDFFSSYSNTTGNEIVINPVAKYTGPGPSAGTDTITLDFLQDFLDPRPGSWAGPYTETIPLSSTGSFGPGSSIGAQLLYDTVGIGAVSCPAPGSCFFEETTSLDFGAADSSSFLAADYNFTFVFGRGTAVGALAAAGAPEPAMLMPGGLALLAIGLMVWRKRSTSGVAA